MKTISQYREDIKNLMKKSGDIDAQATTEGRDLSEEEVKLKTEMFDTVEELRRKVQVMERQERVMADLEKTPDPESRPKPTDQKNDRDKRDKFATFGEQLGAVMRAGLPGGRAAIDPRLYNVRAITGMSETVPSDGGLI